MNPGEGAPAGPRAKMARVAGSAESVEQIQKSDASGGRPDISKSCDFSLKCAASGIR